MGTTRTTTPRASPSRSTLPKLLTPYPGVTSSAVWKALASSHLYLSVGFVLASVHLLPWLDTMEQLTTISKELEDLSREIR